MTKYYIIIPARLHSIRLPNKLLLDLGGKPIIQHVYERALMCKFDKVIIATDSEEIKKLTSCLGATVCMTSRDHLSGTSRIGEAIEMLTINDEDIIINIQGDEPLIPVENIKQIASLLDKNNSAFMATLYEKIVDESEIHDPNCVKVVFNCKQEALYFSRAPIPWHTNNLFKPTNGRKTEHCYRHIGIYAYRVKCLKLYAKMDESPLEKNESLEQLRVLWHQKKIIVAQALSPSPPGVDTQRDLDKLRKIYTPLF